MISPSNLDEFNLEKPIEIIIEPQDHTDIKLASFEVISFVGKEMKISLDI
jgi:hypothetical protein